MCAVLFIGTACRDRRESSAELPSSNDAAEARTCGSLPTFADQRSPAVVVHVTPNGSDQATGFSTQPFRTIARAARASAPGTAIHVHAGTYEGRTFLIDLHGTADAPIWIIGAPGEPRPVIQGGAEGLHLIKPRYVAIANLEIRDTADNGINVDDGDEVADADAARYVVFSDLDVHDTGKHPSGVANCLKLAGVNDVVIRRSQFARCGASPESGALGVDGVGIQRATVAYNRFEANGFGGVQFKGGSGDIDIRNNWFLNAGWRGVAMGGSTGDAFYRPPLASAGLNAEASRVRVVGNVFTGGETAAAFTGCVDCQFAHNTVIDPGKWALRILQERVTDQRYAFAPASRGVIAGNLFYFRRSDLATGEDINVGAGTESRSFSLIGNLWYAHDAPAQSKPRLPAFEGTESEAIVGVDPEFVDARAGNFRLKPTSPVRAAGATRFAPVSDVFGACYANPPSLGAVQFERPGVPRQ